MRAATGTVVSMDRRSFLTVAARTGLGATGAALGLAACAQPERDLLADVDVDGIVLGPADPTTTDPALSPTTPTPPPIPVEDLVGISFVARASGPTVDVRSEIVDPVPTWTFVDPIASGGPLVFLVEDDFVTERSTAELLAADDLRVLVPVRPNGSAGWIRATDVDLEFHNFRIVVALDGFSLSVLDHDREIFTTAVGVARDNAPTPQGVYYTTELLRPPSPSSVYGAYAYGLSGYSDTFEEFAGGPGQLGIHGTNDPSSIGTAVSSGCVRMHNEDITHLVENIGLPVGVPVEIQA